MEIKCLEALGQFWLLLAMLVRLGFVPEVRVLGQ